MIEVKPPAEVTDGITRSVPRVFLAGSIENGKAEPWQEEIVIVLADYDGIVYNPRRDDWDPNADEETIRQQIVWEQRAIDRSDIVVFYFDPETTSPITLLELGQCLGVGGVGPFETKQIIVCCPKAYYRYLNVHETIHIWPTRVQFTTSPFGLISALRDTVEQWA